MKPYYKKGGFFERVERFSDWIDDQLYRWNGINLLIKDIEEIEYWIERLNSYRLRRSINEERRKIEVSALVSRLKPVVNLYNREKYWWMRAK